MLSSSPRSPASAFCLPPRLYFAWKLFISVDVDLVVLAFCPVDVKHRSNSQSFHFFLSNLLRVHPKYKILSAMNLSIKHLPYAVASYATIFLGIGGVSPIAVADAQSTDNINNAHTVIAGDHYADCTSSFCFTGPNWGDNGKRRERERDIYFYGDNELSHYICCV